MLKQLFSRLRSGRAIPPSAGPVSVDALYAQAVAAWSAGDLDGASRTLEAALAIDNNLPVLLYLSGSIALKRQQYPAAIEAFERCLDGVPGFPLVLHARVQAALARAEIELAAGRPAPLETLQAPRRLLSMIICSIDPAKYAAVCANLEGHLAGVPHEIIGVHDARHMYDGWQKGLAQARGELLVFCHDDIAVHAPDFAARLLNRLDEYELLGPAGSMGLSGEGWLYSRPDMRGQVGVPVPGGITVNVFGMDGPVCERPMVLDGMFLACTRALAEGIGFDAERFDGWHLYDFDFSYRAWLAGQRTAVCPDLLVTHASTGGFGADWRRYAERFAAKHPAAGVQFGAEHPPELISVAVASVQQWQWVTRDLCTARPR